jgi:hypothetical protein
MMEFVRLDHHPNISQLLGKMKFMFQTTNQMLAFWIMMGMIHHRICRDGK